MESAEKDLESINKLIKTQKYDEKRLPRLFKFLGYIKSVGDYDKYFKDNITLPIIDWIVKVLFIRPIILFLGLICLTAGATPTTILTSLAVGISICWFLLIELKKELWRKK